MKEISVGLDQTEEEILTCEVSDQALENAARTKSEKAGNYTLAWCTWLTGCPI